MRQRKLVPPPPTELVRDGRGIIHGSVVNVYSISPFRYNRWEQKTLLEKGRLAVTALAR
jgi:hypothetical protein